MASLIAPKDLPLEVQKKWYKIRDMFYGDNYVSRNISLALEMAASCKHPDACWLTQACAGKNVKTVEDVERVFSALGENDARALSFLGLIGDGDVSLLRRSAKLGFAWAQALVAWNTQGDEKFKFAQLSAGQGERDGFFWLGVCFGHGKGCEQDLDKAKKYFLIASELGYVWAMCELGRLLDDSDPQRWYWYGRAAALGNTMVFFLHIAREVELFNCGSGRNAVMFAIGQVLQGHVNEDAKTIFNTNGNFDSLIVPAKKAIAFYEAQIKATKDAMYAWTQVGLRCRVVKDIRKFISALIWNSRAEALF